jgi:hypothetical protein
MKRKTREMFIEDANKVHNNIYDYSKIEYINNKTEVCIICKEHGEFWQRPDRHLQGQGCPICRYIKSASSNRKEVEEFINSTVDVHGDKYDYSKVKYINNKTKVCIICPKHGEFWQTPHSHLSGDGCPYCKFSHLENEIKLMLDENGILYESQKRFDWLNKMSLDFYIPSKNIAIECQGSQHYIPYSFFGGEDKLFETQKRDKEKLKLCSEHGIKILYYGHYKNCIKNKLLILTKIT